MRDFPLHNRDLIGEGYAIEGGVLRGCCPLRSGVLLTYLRAPCFVAPLPYRSSEWVFLCTMHHIISDGWSMVSCQGSSVALWFAFFWFGVDLPSLELQYRDYASWESGHLSGDFFLSLVPTG
ncbi:condensation domain-containing protein [Sphingobacterium sp. ML3W]|uniref:condensation domain-containing protein n=1 Tax=Sphingobacterium sp. ML3W TaxID=1538644 RepID=UPI00384B3A17